MCVCVSVSQGVYQCVYQGECVRECINVNGCVYQRVYQCECVSGSVSVCVSVC